VEEVLIRTKGQEWLTHEQLANRIGMVPSSVSNVLHRKMLKDGVVEKRRSGKTWEWRWLGSEDQGQES